MCNHHYSFGCKQAIAILLPDSRSTGRNCLFTVAQEILDVGQVGSLWSNRALFAMRWYIMAGRVFCRAYFLPDLRSGVVLFEQKKAKAKFCKKKKEAHDRRLEFMKFKNILQATDSRSFETRPLSLDTAVQATSETTFLCFSGFLNKSSTHIAVGNNIIYVLKLTREFS